MASMEDNAKRAPQDRESGEHRVRHEAAGRRRREPLPPSQRPDRATRVSSRLGAILGGPSNGVSVNPGVSKESYFSVGSGNQIMDTLL